MSKLTLQTKPFPMNDLRNVKYRLVQETREVALATLTNRHVALYKNRIFKYTFMFFKWEIAA